MDDPRLSGSLRLWRALRRGEIVFHYQPKILVATGQPVAVEALARWEHPTRGLLAPARWLHLLDVRWLERRFLHYTLDTVLGQAARWKSTKWDLTVCLNVSPRSFCDPRLPGEVWAALDRHGLAPADIMIELTEAALDISPVTAQVAERLNELGVALSLDDFGIGHSAMERLVRLPLGELKIDRSFVTELPAKVRESAVVRAAIGLAQHLDMACVAEGVETPAALDSLRHQGCDVAQGYHISRPLAPNLLAAWLADEAGRAHLVPSSTHQPERRIARRRMEDRILRRGAGAGRVNPITSSSWH
jgi:EAL domain-containing protein (putative c-di-GMP-specific phosphodiesterase class I)